MKLILLNKLLSNSVETASMIFLDKYIYVFVLNLCTLSCYVKIHLL
jgi:hypothetical protein